MPHHQSAEIKVGASQSLDALRQVVKLIIQQRIERAGVVIAQVDEAGRRTGVAEWDEFRREPGSTFLLRPILRLQFEEIVQMEDRRRQSIPVPEL